MISNFECRISYIDTAIPLLASNKKRMSLEKKAAQKQAASFFEKEDLFGFGPQNKLRDLATTLCLQRLNNPPAQLSSEQHEQLWKAKALLKAAIQCRKSYYENSNWGKISLFFQSLIGKTSLEIANDILDQYNQVLSETTLTEVKEGHILPKKMQTAARVGCWKVKSFSEKQTYYIRSKPDSMRITRPKYLFAGPDLYYEFESQNQKSTGANKELLIAKKHANGTSETVAVLVPHTNKMTHENNLKSAQWGAAELMRESKVYTESLGSEFPYIPKWHGCFAIGENDGVLHRGFLVTQLGTSDLKTFLRRATRNNFSYQERIALMGELINAMQSFHEKGLVHLDIKPGNIVLNIEKKGQKTNVNPRFIDFGTTKKISTLVGLNEGTPSYLPPERLDNKQIASNEKHDVWSLGLVLYEIYYGSHLIQEIRLSKMEAVKEKKASGKIKSPFDEIKYLISKINSSDFDDRPISRLIKLMLVSDPKVRPNMTDIQKAWREISPANTSSSDNSSVQNSHKPINGSSSNSNDSTTSL